MKLTIQEPAQKFILASELKIGQLGISLTTDHILLRTHNNIVDLTEPKNIWELNCTIQIQPIPLGTKIEMITTV